jgi:predicted  nucleic acid-binding Zn-ribbon protein
MSKSYNQLVNELKRANKQIKNLEFLAEVEVQEQKKTNNTNLELLGQIEKLERQLSRAKGRFDGAEKSCLKYEKEIMKLNNCLKSKNEFIEDLQSQINSLINYSEALEVDSEENAASVSELTQAIKTISKFLK